MIKKAIAATLLTASLAGGGSYYQYYTSVRHPTVEQTDEGWNFTYNLCIPRPIPLKCVPVTRTLPVPKGAESRMLPKPHRLKDIETIDDAREEAEMVADMIEGKYKGP